MAFVNKIEDNFSIIPNGIFRNKVCGYKEIAIICFVASKPDGWQFRAKNIGDEIGLSRNSVQRILKSLEKKGYIQRIKHNDGTIDYVLYYPPFSYSNAQISRPNAQIPNRGSRGSKGKCIPVPEIGAESVHSFASEQKQCTILRLSLYNNINIKNMEEIYDAYPSRVGKKKALEAIKNALKEIDSDTLKQKVIAFAEDAKKWLPENRKYIPNPSTWFNQGRWNDDLSVYLKYKDPSHKQLANYQSSQLPQYYNSGALVQQVQNQKKCQHERGEEWIPT